MNLLRKLHSVKLATGTYNYYADGSLEYSRGEGNNRQILVSSLGRCQFDSGYILPEEINTALTLWAIWHKQSPGAHSCVLQSGEVLLRFECDRVEWRREEGTEWYTAIENGHLLSGVSGLSISQVQDALDLWKKCHSELLPDWCFVVGNNVALHFNRDNFKVCTDVANELEQVLNWIRAQLYFAADLGGSDEG